MVECGTSEQQCALVLCSSARNLQFTYLQFLWASLL